MGKSKKKMIIGTVAGVTAIVVCVTGALLWHNFSGGKTADGLAYVSAVSDMNTAAAAAADFQFAGVVEPQETKEIKVDVSKTIKEVLVQDGAHVEAGAPLYTYDVESMQLELQQGNVEIERMQNEITQNQQQIKQLETEKTSASADDKLTYTTQIQSLQTDIAKSEYDIKTKKIELEKLQNTIDHATVTAEIAGTIQSLKTVEQLQTDGGDVLMKLTSDGEFRVKCTVSEQNIQMLYVDEAVTLHSRIDDTTWNGTVTEIGTEAETNQDNTMYYGGDGTTTASKYPFYITLDSSDGLMLGQHLLVSPDESSTIEKNGIWLYADYVTTDEDGKSFVWAANGHDRLEKREVEIGQTDDMMGDCEITSGLSGDDMIAFPSDSYEEGMRVTTNMEDLSSQEDADMGEGNVMNDDNMMDDENAMGDGAVMDDAQGALDAAGDGGALDAENEDTALPEDADDGALEGGAADGT